MLKEKILLSLIFVLFVIERIRNSRNQKEVSGVIKYYWVTFLLIFSYSTSLTIAFFDFLMKTYLNMVVSSFGLILVILGIIFRKNAYRSLGKNWSIHIKLIKDQQLIKNGLYKYFKHPYYLSVMFELIGISLYCNSLLAFYFIAIVHLPLVLIRIYLEEKNLVSQFGCFYLNYFNS